jgi:phenylacetic acid degradation operon negative regulatory protein
MDPIAPLIQSLHSQGRLRVWSLVITVFGDSVLPRGGRVSTLRLQTLLGRIGIESGTLRTALSRLARDGWVSAERAGKTSIYQLNTKGHADFAAATNRIYAAPHAAPITEWSLSSSKTVDSLPVGNLWLCPANSTHKRADFEVRGPLTLSDARRETLLDPEHITSLQVLFDDLDALDNITLDPLSAAAAQILLLHRWRRIVLRFPDVPAQILPQSFRGRDPRGCVARAYHHLAAPADTWWCSAEGDMPAMPAAYNAMAKRFGAA